MKCLLWLTVAALLSGCQTTRYVPTSCLTKEQFAELKQSLPPKVGERLTGNAAEDIKIIAGSNVRLRGYAEGLLNVLGGCVG